MTSIPPSRPRRTRRWLWITLSLVLLPFLVLGVTVIQAMTLDRTAATLRRAMAGGASGALETKMQVSIGPVLLSGLRLGLAFASHPDAVRARSALGSIRHASVGVYQQIPSDDPAAARAALQRVRQTLSRQGWMPVVSVLEGADSVLVFTREGVTDRSPLDLCMAVRDGRDVVVVSASLHPQALEGWLAREWPHVMATTLGRAVTARPASGT